MLNQQSMNTVETPEKPFPGWFLPALVLVFSIFLLSVLRALPDTIDDAHISYRYAENFASGYGLSFNPGDIVEGYSNPLWVFLISLFVRVGFQAEFAGTLLGFASILLALYSVTGMTKLITKTRESLFLAASLLLSFFPFIYYSLSGLETGLLAALIGYGTLLLLQTRGQLNLLLVFVWFLVSISRPEAPLYLLCVGIVASGVIYPEKKASKNAKLARRNSLIHLLVLLALFAVFLVWRVLYFGDLVPNTFYAKPMGTGMLVPAGAGIQAGIDYLYSFALDLGLLIPIAVLGTLIPKYFVSHIRTLWVMLLPGIVFGIYSGGDWMPWGRYLIPSLLPLLALSVVMAEAISERIHQVSQQKWMASMPALVFIFSILLNSSLSLTDAYLRRHKYPYHVMNSADCVLAAKSLKARLGSDHSIVAHRIGALGRFSGWYVIDLFGLVDRDIAMIIKDEPLYHPTDSRGEDIEELKLHLKARTPDFVTKIYRVSKEPESTLSLYDYKFELDSVFLLGEDEKWGIYRRVQ